MIQILRRFLHRQEQAVRPFCTAVVAAGGNSTRMGENKQLMLLDGVPVLIRTIQSLYQAEQVDEIILAVREADMVTIADLCHSYGLTEGVKIVKGGSNRLESVRNGIAAASPKAKLLAIHDGARPLATPELIDRVIVCATEKQAVAPAIPVKDTIKVAQNHIVQGTPERATLFAVQTPQVFEADLLKSALQSVWESGAEITDDCSAVERLGKEIYLLEGEEENLKITTPLDILVAEAILRRREEML